MKSKIHYNSPIGTILIEEYDGKIVRLCIDENVAENEMETPLLGRAASQLEEYFNGKRFEFDLPIEYNGTAFQHQVWQALETIPYGETRSYGDIAKQIGNPKAVRAVGGANNKNPIMIIVPCHRVIGADGRLVGFAPGVEKKKHLLELEAKFKEVNRKK